MDADDEKGRTARDGRRDVMGDVIDVLFCDVMAAGSDVIGVGPPFGNSAL